MSVTNSCLDDVIAATIEDLNIDSCVRVIVYTVVLTSIGTVLLSVS